jgi:exosortase
LGTSRLLPAFVLLLASRHPRKSMTNRARYVSVFVLVGVSIALWWQSFAESLQLALNSEAHTHILLILPLCLALIYSQSRSFPAVIDSGGSAGVILLSAALLLRGFTAWNFCQMSSSSRLSLSMFAVVSWWIGSVVLCFGVQVFRRFLFPLCFLFLIVPLPENAVSWTVEFLQYKSAVATEILFRLAHVPVQRDGIWILIPGLNIEVERSCSSIRSSIILIVMTLVLAQLFLRSWWRKTLLVVVAVPLSIAKNAVRIFTLAELGTRVNAGYLTGRLHRQGGIVFLGVALLFIIGMLWGLRRSETQEPSAKRLR